MRTDLDHLPPAKQRELERVVQILFEEFEEARGARDPGVEEEGPDPQDHPLRLLCARRLGRRAAHRQGLPVRLRPADHRQRQAADRPRRILGEGRGAAQPRALDHKDAEDAGQLHRPHASRGERWSRARPLLLHRRRPRRHRASTRATTASLPSPSRRRPTQALAMAKEYFEEWFPSALQRS